MLICLVYFDTDFAAYSANDITSSIEVTMAAFTINTNRGPDVIDTTATSSHASAKVILSMTIPTTASYTVPDREVLSFESAVVHYTIFDPVPFALFDAHSLLIRVTLRDSRNSTSREVVHTILTPAPSAIVDDQ